MVFLETLVEVVIVRVVVFRCVYSVPECGVVPVDPLLALLRKSLKSFDVIGGHSPAKRWEVRGALISLVDRVGGSVLLLPFPEEILA